MWIIEKWKQKGLFENKYQSFDFQIRLPTPNLSGTRANDIANLNNPPMPVDSNLLVSISNQNDTVKDAINDVIDVLTVSEKIINFLSENKGSWEIEDNSIVFDTQKLSDEYDKLVSEI